MFQECYLLRLSKIALCKFEIILLVHSFCSPSGLRKLCNFALAFKTFMLCADSQLHQSASPQGKMGQEVPRGNVRALHTSGPACRLCGQGMFAKVACLLQSSNGASLQMALQQIKD